MSSSQISTTFFQNANNIHVEGGNFTVETTVNNNKPHSPIDLLLEHCALDALVDSSERYDPPKCSPHTRDAITEEIIAWVNSSDQAPSFLWLHGSAGAGKSAICQTIGEDLKLQNTLLASFFFSRVAGSSGRCNGDRLIPTLVYQMLQIFPETRRLVQDEIRKDPGILMKNRLCQITNLFLKPLSSFSWRKLIRSLTKSQARLIIIDGLDECQGIEVQCDLLRILASTASKLSLPLRFLISSRPEGHIVNTFDHPKVFENVGVHRLNLDEDPTALIGVRKFLRDSFNAICETHPLRQYIDSSWPGEHVLELLARKSSPQFVFASTVIKYIQSPKHLPPVRLDKVIEVVRSTFSDKDDSPLHELDKLYAFIFSSINEDRVTVWCILGIISLSHDNWCNPDSSPDFCDKVLELHLGSTYILLEPLSSVLSIPKNPNKPIESLHASLFDFLLDPGRSGSLFLDLDSSRKMILKGCCSNGPLDGNLEWTRTMMFHASAINKAADIMVPIDSILIALFRKVLWEREQHPDITDIYWPLVGIDEAFDLLASEALDPDWLSVRLDFYQTCLPEFILPSFNPFKTKYQRTKHCCYSKMVQLFVPSGYSEDWNLDLFEQDLYFHVDSVTHLLVRQLHLAAAFAANSYCGEYLRFITSVGVFVCCKVMESDLDADVVIGCREIILKALKEDENALTVDFRRAIRLWSGIQINGRVTSRRPRRGSFVEDLNSMKRATKAYRFALDVKRTRRNSM